MQLSDYDYELPADLIAQRPVEPRDASRLLVAHRESGRIEHRRFSDLPRFLHAGDLLVVNDSRVVNARLRGRWADSGGAVEALLLHPDQTGTWQALIRTGRRIVAGYRIRWAAGGESEVVAGPADGVSLITLPAGFDLHTAGELPLPPYIHETPDDPERYQTVYAEEEGSVAAPTAGLHFTPGLLRGLEDDGVGVVRVTLHVGVGTFRPVQVDAVAEHRMHAEFGRVPAETARRVSATRDAGGRVVAVGTTSIRLLEQWAQDGASLEGWQGWTSLFILPGFEFRAIDAMITNFHLPRTTLLMLVGAFAGEALRRAAYAEAVRKRYRFYSFGDAMLIL